ncbi:L,D-transpeptidase [Aureimonas glaciei]|uniref:L,D-TPase catalytic domain-containing protein n=1 Tax=Aureimonas glaciei TaxID=1776957 RepID=A0A917DAD9_9HYPH|nr:L,D-transpeptidase [Aureimonas glaciei]GGD17678.1 hypothetical protein GCM10011335_20610 [Aureimonas glaciei]
MHSFTLSTLRAGAVVIAGLSAAACTTTSAPAPVAFAPEPRIDANAARMYGAVLDDGWAIPAVDPVKMDPRNVRQVVDFPTPEPVGTVVVDPHERFLYLVMEGGKAMRYGVGVGKAGLEFTGEGIIQRKAAWPRWTPTPDMIAREPEKYGPLRQGMDGGIENPLGARALYLFKNGQDTLFRIHGTNQEWSIGKAVSSGCIRMLNQDVIDLNTRVPPKTRVVVLGAPVQPGATA